MDPVIAKYVERIAWVELRVSIHDLDELLNDPSACTRYAEQVHWESLPSGYPEVHTRVSRAAFHILATQPDTVHMLELASDELATLAKMGSYVALVYLPIVKAWEKYE